MKRIAVIAFLLLSSMHPVLLFAQELPVDESQIEWSTLETGYITVYYSPDSDLDKMESSLRRRVSFFSSDEPGDGAPVEDKIRYQLDALFRRSRDILDMRPTDMHLIIKVFKTRKELNDEYSRIFKEDEERPEDVESAEGTETLKEPREDFRSFYINKYNTIYTSEEDISDSVIAHEMAHAIVDHYFAVIPPEKVRELLASYVDLHLAE